MFIKFGVDSSSFFLLECRHTDRQAHIQSHRHHWSPYPCSGTT